MLFRSLNDGYLMLLESVIENLLNIGSHIVLGFLPVLHNVDMDGFVVIRIEFENISKEDKDCWHNRFTIVV